MKIALRSSNGLYVSAEEGGGIDTRDPHTPIAVRANRSLIGAWETFTTIPVDGFVALQTANGFYLTAENGGGGALRTNATEIGPWESFVALDGVFITWDGQHVLSVNPDGVVEARDLLARFTVTVIEPDPTPEPPHPDLPILHEWRGCFCIPNALPGIPYGDGSRIWTPAYGCYDEIWRTAIRQAYKQRGYTHFVYNCAGLPYRNDYPELADDPARVNRDLIELMGSGLVPVVCATDDRNPSKLCESFLQNGGSIAISFPLWEQNESIGPRPNEDAQKALIDATVAAAPSAECYLHFTPGHGSISYVNEIDGWTWCQAHGTTGLLAQGSNRFAAETPQVGGEGLESTAVRLLGLPSAPPAWHDVKQLTVKFEYGVYDMYHGHVDEPTMRAYTASFLSFAPHVTGFCDGGPAKVRV